jgi:hypothetical protein
LSSALPPSPFLMASQSPTGFASQRFRPARGEITLPQTPISSALPVPGRCPSSMLKPALGLRGFGISPAEGGCSRERTLSVWIRHGERRFRGTVERETGSAPTTRRGGSSPSPLPSGGPGGGRSVGAGVAQELEELTVLHVSHGIPLAEDAPRRDVWFLHSVEGDLHDGDGSQGQHAAGGAPRDPRDPLLAVLRV